MTSISFVDDVRLASSSEEAEVFSCFDAVIQRGFLLFNLQRFFEGQSLPVVCSAYDLGVTLNCIDLQFLVVNHQLGITLKNAFDMCPSFTLVKMFVYGTVFLRPSVLFCPVEHR